MNQHIQISFITITYNGLNDTCELIDSIHNIVKSTTYEIIVVDNASKINEAEIIKDRYPDVVTIRSEVNLGFSGGNNLGIKQTKGDYLFLINNDTYILEDNLNQLITHLEEDCFIGGCSPKICYADSPQILQFAGFTELSPITLRNETIGNKQTDCAQYDTVFPTAYLHGAAMLIKKKVIEQVGFMPDIYFLYYEEIDWSTAIRNKGYKLIYDPCATIYHKESQSAGLNSTLQAYYLTRNRLLYAYRNLSGHKRLLSIAYQTLVSSTKNSLLYLLKGNIPYSLSIWKGVLAFYTLNKK